MNASQFLNMCLDFQVCPDLWNIREYSAWLTPLGRGDPGARRFDTIFYTAFLDNVEGACLDDIEVTDLTWTDPESILEDAKAKKLWVAPPRIVNPSVGGW